MYFERRMQLSGLIDAHSAHANRWLLVLFLGPILAIASGLRAEANSPRQVKVSLDAKGRIIGHGDEQEQESGTPLIVAARLAYGERPLVVDETKTSDWIVAARFYGQAAARIHLGKTTLDSSLRTERSLILVRSDPEADKLDLLSPNGPLTRQELDLIQMPASSHLINRLVPAGEVRVGQHWNHDLQTVSVLFLLDSLMESSVKSTLKSMKGQVAVVALDGKVIGTVDGAETNIELNGTYHLHVAQKRISWIQLRMKEQRSLGPATPGVEVESDFRMLIDHETQCPELDELKLAPLLNGHDSSTARLSIVSNTGKFELLADRRWHVLSEGPEGIVLRLLDRGDLIAQCNMSRLPDLVPGKQIDLDEFQSDIRRALGQEFDQFAQAEVTTAQDGLRTLRVVALGHAGGVPIRWVYHHRSNAAGYRAAFVFTLEDALRSRFGAADEDLVEGLRLEEVGR